MDKMNHTAYVYKADKRTKSGERLVATSVWRDCDALTVIRKIELRYPEAEFRIEVVPTTKTVKNLMTGALVEIPHDTPRACDPSSELYWSM